MNNVNNFPIDIFFPSLDLSKSKESLKDQYAHVFHKLHSLTSIPLDQEYLFKVSNSTYFFYQYESDFINWVQNDLLQILHEEETRNLTIQLIKIIQNRIDDINQNVSDNFKKITTCLFIALLSRSLETSDYKIDELLKDLDTLKNISNFLDYGATQFLGYELLKQDFWYNKELVNSLYRQFYIYLFKNIDLILNSHENLAKKLFTSLRHVPETLKDPLSDPVIFEQIYNNHKEIFPLLIEASYIFVQTFVMINSDEITEHICNLIRDYKPIPLAKICSFNLAQTATNYSAIENFLTKLLNYNLLNNFVISVCFKHAVNLLNYPLISFFSKNLSNNYLLNSIKNKSIAMRSLPIARKITQAIFNNPYDAEKVIIERFMSLPFELSEIDLDDLKGKTFDANNALKISKANFHLNLIKNISLATLEFPYPEILGLPKEVSQREDLFFKYALCSPLEDVIALMEPEDLAKLPEFLKTLSLLVRLPQGFRGAIDKEFWNFEEYAKSSRNYAKGNLEFIKGELDFISKQENLSNYTLKGLLGRIVNSRKQNNPSLIDDYLEFKIDMPANLPAQNYTVLADRYLPCSKFLIDSINSYSNNPESSKNMKVTLSDIIFTYPIDKEDIPITTIVFQQNIYTRSFIFNNQTDEEKLLDFLLDTVHEMVWMHPKRNSILKCQDRREKLHKQIFEYKLDLNDQQHLKDFYALVAEHYWLMSTLCETFRGTPHNSMVTLNEIYLYHELPPPIPKLGYYFLDNVMLVMPVNEAIAKWHTFFEKPWDKLTKREYVEAALNLNPELLKIASPELKASVQHMNKKRKTTKI